MSCRLSAATVEWYRLQTQMHIPLRLASSVYSEPDQSDFCGTLEEGQSCDMHVGVMWYCMWESCDITCGSCDMHVEVMWHAYGSHVTLHAAVMRKDNSLLDLHYGVIAMWLSCDYHMTDPAIYSLTQLFPWLCVHLVNEEVFSSCHEDSLWGVDGGCVYLGLEGVGFEWLQADGRRGGEMWECDGEGKTEMERECWLTLQVMHLHVYSMKNQ